MSAPLVVINNYNDNKEQLDEILFYVKRIYTQGNKLSEADKLIVKENADLHKQIKDLLDGTTVAPEIKKQIDVAIAKVDSNTKDLLKAVNDNQPQGG